VGGAPASGRFGGGGPRDALAFARALTATVAAETAARRGVLSG
jgi:hypothetical protein